MPMRKILAKMFMDNFAKNTGAGLVENWRAVFGYCVSFSWLLMMITICFVVLKKDERAIEIIHAFSETATLWGSILGVLGISVMKNTSIKKKKTKQ